MLLFELLNKPGQWEEIPAQHGEWKAEMTMPDGRVIEYHIHDSYYPDVVEMEFSDKSQTRIGDSVGITGGGGELVIFSTALEILNQFLQKNPNKIVSFSASEANRASLYDRMIKRKLPSGYDSFSFEEKSIVGDEMNFYIGKPEALEQLKARKAEQQRKFEERRG